MRRRDFIAGVGILASWALPVDAQVASRVARIGLMESVPERDAGAIARDKAFRQEMDRLGWQVGRNLAIDYRWSAFDIESAQLAAAELMRLIPDVFLCSGTPATLVLKQTTSTVPIVFVSVSEPVAQGLVQSLARPGGNLTGFTFLEPTLGGKWLGLLKEIAPQTKHAALMFNPASSPTSGSLRLAPPPANRDQLT
jgi:putative tryptophan/tyrosine transport system substrate-binding protein